ncbi:MAG: cytochrome c oxidase subunit II [Verrucomicrobiota bacterium]
MFSLNKLIGLPELYSVHGELVDHMLEIVHWFMLVLFVGWTFFFFYVLWRYRQRRNPKANYKGVQSHMSTHAEVMVVIVEVVLLLGFAFPLWATRSEDFPVGPEVVRVRAVGEQFLWTFHYPGADGVFGRVDPRLYSPTNPAGVDGDDPNGKDDFAVQGRLRMPIDRPIIVQVTSKDVIHGLSLGPMRIQQDAIPGQEIPMWFTPNRISEGDIICAQLCGAGHATMYASFEVMESEEFDNWVASRAPAPEAGDDDGAAEEPVAAR